MKINLINIKKNYQEYDSKREKIILKSRLVLKSAKNLINSIHKDSKNESQAREKVLKKDWNALIDLSKKDERLKNEGSFYEASEEYAEAELYYDFTFSNNLRKVEELGCSDEAYLGALSDLTGELARKSVKLAIKKNYDEIYKILEFVSEIYKEMSDITFRNSNLRKKYDSIKWNFNKIEDIIYDIEIKSK